MTIRTESSRLKSDKKCLRRSLFERRLMCLAIDTFDGASDSVPLLLTIPNRSLTFLGDSCKLGYSSLFAVIFIFEVQDTCFMDFVSSLGYLQVKRLIREIFTLLVGSGCFVIFWTYLLI